jgi:hypothetical protein
VVTSISREQALGFRVRAQQLDGEPGDRPRRLAEAAVLDIGVQDTGPDGGRWALALRGLDVSSLPDDALVLLWTVRGAPHFYRRTDLPRVAAEVAPFSDADAAKRIYDAAKPLRAAGIGALAALDAVATAMRSIVVEPMAKGELSTRLTRAMDPPYLRFCRSCGATHLYEMPFRLAAVRAGLELTPGTSPPVLRRTPGFAPATATGPSAGAALVRAYLRLLGPATPKHVADYLDAPVKEVQAHWPADAAEVSLDGETRWVLAADRDALAAGPARTTRLLGPYDLFLQAKDRPLLVDDPARARALWPALGRPGALLVDGEVAGLWRPRAAGARLRLQVQPWRRLSRAARDGLAAEAERLAAHRGRALAGVDLTD